MKTNQQYLEDIQAAGMVFCSKDTTKRAKIAVNVLKNRTKKGYKQGEITKKELETVLNWLENVQKIL